ncbi:MAG: alpha-galactosidase [Spirochaetales bacterium]
MHEPWVKLRDTSASAGLGACYSSAQVVLDEGFKDGRLCTRFWSAAGQIVPEMYLEKAVWGTDEPADSFSVAIDGQDLAGGYEWVGASLEPDTSNLRTTGSKSLVAVIVLRHAATGVEVRVHTRLDGGPFLVRWLEIVNTSSKPVSITTANPFGGLLWTRRTDEHLPTTVPGEARPSPFALAHNHLFQWGQEGDFWFEPLADGVKVVNGGKVGRSGWGRPAFWARDNVSGQTFVCELAWGGNYEFQLDCRLGVSPSQAKLFFRLGLSGQDKALRIAQSGEVVTTPAVHLALFQTDNDQIVQATHHHVRQVVMPAQLPGRHVEIEANHRGYLCDRENEVDLLRDVEVAAAIGAEMYVIDAGWYGNDPNQWWNNAGDWEAGSWLPNGIEPVIAHAKKLGMRFGLWVEIEAAGASSTLKKDHPEWLLRRDGRPVNNGRALDFSNPALVSWAEGELERIIRRYDLDMYRIDHNHLINPSGNRKFEGFTEDLTWRYYDGLFGMFRRLRLKFPEVVFQNCAGGGGRLDWGTLGLFHNTELSDWMRMPRGLRILNNVTMSLPPEVLLRTFGTEVGELDLDADLDSQLRMVCLCRPIFRGIAPSVAELSPYLKERILHHLGLYQKVIRPVLLEGKVFHHTPYQPIYAHSPWTVLEYASPNGLSAVAGLFRTSDEGASEYLFKPRGLKLGTRYRVTRDNSGDSYLATGQELSNTGLAVRLGTMSSELIHFSEDKL